MLNLIAITQKMRTSFAMMLITASNFANVAILSPKCEIYKELPKCEISKELLKCEFSKKVDKSLV